jgi:hypothetical protein
VTAALSFRSLPFLLVVSAAVLTSGAGPEPPPAPAPFGLAATARQLLRIQPVEETAVPPAARSLITTWKKQLRGFISRELNAGLYRDASADRIRDDLKAALAREGVPVGEEPKAADGPYGWLNSLDVQRPAGHDRLLAVAVTQEISCGTDTSLYLFEWKDERWRLAFALESNGYDEVSGALGSFDFRISPPDKKGGFFIIAADVNPWCSSNWQRIRYRAYHLGSDPLRPVPFFEETAGIFERDFELTVKEDQFRVTFQGSQSLDAGILTRDYVRAFRVTGTKAERIGPLADEARGFIDEWISQPWEIAERWADPSHRTQLKAWHDRLKERLEKLYTEFGSLEDCGPSCSQIWLDIDPDPHPNTLPRELYFIVQRRGEDFRMERIDVGEPPRARSQGRSSADPRRRASVR